MIKYKRIPKAEARDLYRDGRPVYILPVEPRRISIRDNGAYSIGDFDSRVDRMHDQARAELAYFTARD